MYFILLRKIGLNVRRNAPWNSFLVALSKKINYLKYRQQILVLNTAFPLILVVINWLNLRSTSILGKDSNISIKNILGRSKQSSRLITGINSNETVNYCSRSIGVSTTPISTSVAKPLTSSLHLCREQITVTWIKNSGEQHRHP